MSDETTLLPCPFCGGEADISDEGTGTEPFRYWVYCSNNACFVEGTAVYATEAEAIEAWNTRAERTCKPTEEDYCTICGEDLVKCNVGIGFFGGAVELDPPIYHNYCPSCGRKVKQ